MMFVTNWILALAAIVSSLLGFAFLFLILSRSQKYFAARQEDLAKVDGHIEEYFAGNAIVRAYNAQKSTGAAFTAKNEALKASTFKSEFLSSLMGWFFCLIGFKNAVDGLLRGAGDMKMFTIANLVNLIIRVTLAMALAPRFGIAFVWYAVPIGWFANWALSFVRYKTGKWQSKIVVRND